MGIFKNLIAKDIYFNPTGTLLTSKNVEDAIKEVFAGSGGTIVITGTFGIETKTLDSFDKTLGNSVVYDYVIYDGTNSRAGTLTGNWDITTGSSASISDRGTGDIGDTSGIDFDIKISGANVILEVVSSKAGFTIDAIRRIV